MQSTTKTTSFNNAQILSDIIELPNHEQWHLFELNRLFMQERSLFLSYFFRIAATAGIMFYAPIFVTLIWVILSFSLNIWMQRLSTAYDQLLNEIPAPVAVSAAMQQIVNRYQLGWGLNFTIWALFCLITHIWVPENGWLLCAAILNAFMYLSIFRISMKTVLLRQLFLF